MKVHQKVKYGPEQRLWLKGSGLILIMIGGLLNTA